MSAATAAADIAWRWMTARELASAGGFPRSGCFPAVCDGADAMSPDATRSPDTQQTPCVGFAIAIPGPWPRHGCPGPNGQQSLIGVSRAHATAGSPANSSPRPRIDRLRTRCNISSARESRRVTYIDSNDGKSFNTRHREG